MDDHMNIQQTSELRKNVTAESFKSAFLAFMEQADKNAITGKSEGKKTPYGFSANSGFDGAVFHQHFGQGAASKTPYVNWWAVSIYYIPETGGIYLGIEKDRYHALDRIRTKLLAFKKIGKKAMDVAVFYETTKKTVNYEELHECFLNVCEEVMRLGLNGQNGDGEWEPALSEYDPGITKEQWLDFLNNSGRFNDNYRHMMAAIYSFAGEATCRMLAERFGNTPAHYNMTAIQMADQAQRYIKCELWVVNGTIRYWPIMFLGKKAGPGDGGYYVWKLRKPLAEALKEYGIEKYVIKTGGETDMKNLILYGPPGTGKTYNTVCYAVAICEGRNVEDVIAEAKEDYPSVKERYDELKNEGRIEFTTFHQSYSYEEFIEGIRPVMNDSDEGKTVEYEIAAGVFKSFCETASEPISNEEKLDIGLNNNPIVWKVSLEGTGNNPTRSECMENGHIRIGYNSYGENITDETDFSINGGKTVLNAFINKMRIGDIVLSCFSSSTIDAIGVITGEYEWHEEYSAYKRLRKVNWIVKGIQENISEINGSNMTLSTVYKMSVSVSDVLGIIKKYRYNESVGTKNEENYVFIIDEINRGNISKIFGELITLIEPSKRLGQPEELRSVLPYSKKLFGIPDNVYLIGTMNTADRSIAAIDTALRRRFSFREMLPDPTVLRGVEVSGIDIEKMLYSMNKKISVLYDREHTVGHAYFIGLLKEENRNMKTLGAIFRNNIIPLLQEYFYEDYEKIRLVLGDNRKRNGEPEFIKAVENDYRSLFGEEIDLDVSYGYEINEAAFEMPEAYGSI